MELPILALLLVAVTVGTLLAIAFLPAAAGSDEERGVGAFMRLATVAAVCAVMGALMSVAFAANPTSILSLSLANAMTVLSPGMLWCALRRLRGQDRLAPILAIAAATVALLVTVWWAGPIATGIKVLLSAGACILALAETRRRTLVRTRGGTVIGGMCLLYAGFSILRIIVAVVFGEQSEQFQRAFAAEAATVVMSVAIVGCTVGVLMLRRELVPRHSSAIDAAELEQLAGAVLEHGTGITAYTMHVAEIELIRAAHGNAAARRLRQALMTAIEHVLPDAIVASSKTGDAVIAVLVTPPERTVPERIVAEYTRLAPNVDGADTVDVDIVRHTVSSPEQLADLLRVLRPRTRAVEQA